MIRHGKNVHELVLAGSEVKVAILRGTWTIA
jgi:hypothetical protein